MVTADPSRVVAAVWRIESARVVAALTRLVGDFGTAEELAQDALVAALEQWPTEGVPPNPGGWLMSTAKHRAIDLLRRRATYQRKLELLGGDDDGGVEPDPVDALADRLDDPVGDEVLRLIFTACHPVLSTEARVALTLRVVGGLRTDEIARALLVPESTVAQRIVRAKRSLVGVVFELPGPDQLSERLAGVLEIIYLIFNEGYAATTGDDWTRPDLCEEAMRLGRVLAGLAEWESEAHALVALMELQASRLAARIGPDGEPVLLLDQDRRRWDRLLIRRGLAALDRAVELDGRYRPYALQAAIAAEHATAATPDDTDWTRIAALYRVLAHVSPSPIVELNRAVAVGRANGPEHGLAIVEALSAEKALVRYPQLAAVRGDLLARLGRKAEARDAFEEAARLTRNDRERELFLRQARAATSAGQG